MPPDIKKAAIALIVSCISSLIAVYFDGLEFEEISFSDPWTLAVNFIWVAIIAWIIWDLFKGRSIKWTLIIVGAILLAALTLDYVVFGLGIAQVFYLVELLMFILAYIFITSKTSKAWYASNSLSKK